MGRTVTQSLPVLVIGHQRPDTDSAVSAVVYARLLNTLQPRGAVHEGVILGEPSVQTKWLFEQADLPLPRRIEHLHGHVRDAAQTDVFTARAETPLGEALQIIVQHRISLLPVVDDRRQLLGILSDHMPMARYFYHANAEDFLGVLFSVADLERYLRLERWQKPQTEADGQIVLDPARFGPGTLALIGNQPELLLRCRDAGTAVVITCAPGKDAAWRKALRACPGLGVLHYRGSLMALVSQLSLAIPAERLMQTEAFPKLTPDQNLKEAMNIVRQAQYALPVVNPDGSLHGILSRTEILNRPKPQVVLVDHFEQHQAPEGIGEVDIVEIVDHHRVGTLETTVPIRVDCRPLGSTATIIACKFAEAGRRPSPAEAKLLLGAIVADTLLLTSPTTTETDRQQAAALARRARVDLAAFGREVLVRNDETMERPAAELVEKDLKEFAGGGFRFAVAQIETVDRTRLDAARQAEFASALRHRRERGGWDFAALLITDIFRGDSLVLFDTAPATLKHKLGDGGQVWAGCVSRKKQFLPEILRRLNQEHH